jgi:hypothetical protein
MGIGFNAGVQTDENRSVAGVACACRREDLTGSTVNEAPAVFALDSFRSSVRSTSTASLFHHQIPRTD